MKALSRVRLFVTPWTVAYQAPLSKGFSSQGYWSGLPLPSLSLKITPFFLKCAFNWGVIALQCCIVSAVQRRESAESPHICRLPGAPLPPSLPTLYGQNHLMLRSSPLAVHFAHGGVYTAVVLSQFVPLLPPLSPQVPSLRLRLYSCPADRFLSTTFQDSLGTHYSTTFVSLFLTYFTLYNSSRFIHLTTADSSL